MVVKNTLQTIAGTLLSLIVSIFISSVLLVRTLGPDNYGWYSFAMSIISIATSISSLGLNTIAVKFANINKSHADAYYRFSHTLKLIAGLLSAIAIIIFAYSRHDTTSSQRNVLLFLSFVPMMNSWSVFRSRLTTELHAWDNTKNNFIVLTLGTVYRISIVYFKLHWSLFALCVLIDKVTLAILTEISNSKYHHLSRQHWNFQFLPKAEFLRESTPLFIAGVLNILYLRIDQIMLFNLTSPAILSNYSIAVKWTESWYFIPAALVSSVVAKIYSTAGQTEHKMHFVRILNLVGTISLCFVLFFLIFGNVLISSLYGNEYIGAVTPLRILAFAGIVATLGSVWSTYVISIGLQKILLLLVAFSAPGNILLNFILIPRFGAVGAAIATAIANVFPLFIIGMLNSQLRPSTILMIRAASGVPGVREIRTILLKYKAKYSKFIK